MTIRYYKPYTPGTRFRSVSDFKDLAHILFANQKTIVPEKKLTHSFSRSHGRNNRGVITMRHRGAGHKRLYRKIDFKRFNINFIGTVKSIEYDPNRNARISLITQANGSKAYILNALNLTLNSQIVTTLDQNSKVLKQIYKNKKLKAEKMKLKENKQALISLKRKRKKKKANKTKKDETNKINFKNENQTLAISEEKTKKQKMDFDDGLPIGCCLPLKSIPLGRDVHNVELHPGAGGQLARAAGTVAKIISKEGLYVALRLPSGEVRLILKNCWATIGQVGNIEANIPTFGKAGVKRWLGRRPHVRGSAMNPVDHIHGGGEGRSPIGRVQPMNLWGKPALGQKTRKPKKQSSKFILKRRKGFK